MSAPLPRCLVHACSGPPCCLAASHQPSSSIRHQPHFFVRLLLNSRTTQEMRQFGVPCALLPTTKCTSRVRQLPRWRACPAFHLPRCCHSLLQHTGSITALGYATVGQSCPRGFRQRSSPVQLGAGGFTCIAATNAGLGGLPEALSRVRFGITSQYSPHQLYSIMHRSPCTSECGFHAIDIVGSNQFRMSAIGQR
jgi:hypothetical protein